MPPQLVVAIYVFKLKCTFIWFLSINLRVQIISFICIIGQKSMSISNNLSFFFSIIFAMLFISIAGKIKSSIFEGGVFVDISFTILGKTGNNQLDNNRKKDIENVLNEEFCSLNAHSQDNSCFVQSLEFLVKKDY